jgi:hypothetical protein
LKIENNDISQNAFRIIKPQTLAVASEVARASYAKGNVKSQETHKASSLTLPGGKYLIF